MAYPRAACTCLRARTALCHSCHGYIEYQNAPPENDLNYILAIQGWMVLPAFSSADALIHRHIQMEAQHKDPSPMRPLMCNVEPWRPLPLIKVTPDAAASDIVAALPAMLRMAMLNIPPNIKRSMRCHPACLLPTRCLKVTNR